MSHSADPSMPAGSPPQAEDPPPRHSLGTQTQAIDLSRPVPTGRRFGVGSAVFSAVAAGVVAAAAYFSIESASSGTDVERQRRLHTTRGESFAEPAPTPSVRKVGWATIDPDECR